MEYSILLILLMGQIIILILEFAKIKMDFFSNFQFINQYAKELLQPRPCHYANQEIWKYILNKPKYSYQNIELQLMSKQRKMNLSLIRHKSLQIYKSNSKFIAQNQKRPCIVYLHGLSSFAIQGNYLIDYLDMIENCSLCLYDSRGHGRDKAQPITFGMRQSQQLLQVLFKLQQIGITNFILWGRSMGASTILKMVQDYNSIHRSKCLNNGKVKKINISCLVIDSPFVSFQKIAIQMISQQTKLPQLFSRIVYGYLLKGIKENYKFDMHIDILQKCQQINLPTLVLYSQNDKIISPNHAEQIYSKLKSSKEKQMINIQVSHNEVRPPHIIMKVIQMINRCLKNESQKQIQRSSGFYYVKSRNRSRSRSKSISITKSRKTSINIKNQNIENIEKIQKSDQKLSKRQRKSGLSITKDNRTFTQKNQQCYNKTQEEETQENINKKLKVFGSQIIQPKKKYKQKQKQITLINCHKSQQKIKPLGIQTYIYKKQTIMTKPQENNKQKNNQSQRDYHYQPISLMNRYKSPAKLSDCCSKLQKSITLNSISTETQNKSQSQKAIFDQASAMLKINKTFLKQQQRNRNLNEFKCFKERKFRQTQKFQPIKSSLIYQKKIQKDQKNEKQNQSQICYKSKQKQKSKGKGIKIKIISDASNRYKNQDSQRHLIQNKLKLNMNLNLNIKNQYQQNTKSIIVFEKKIQQQNLQNFKTNTININSINSIKMNSINQMTRHKGYVGNLTNLKYL